MSAVVTNPQDLQCRIYWRLRERSEEQEDVGLLDDIDVEGVERLLSDLKNTLTIEEFIEVTRKIERRLDRGLGRAGRFKDPGGLAPAGHQWPSIFSASNVPPKSDTSPPARLSLGGPIDKAL